MAGALKADGKDGKCEPEDHEDSKCEPRAKELVAIFDDWTRRQESALQRLAEEHQHQLDEVCQKILKALAAGQMHGSHHFQSSLSKEFGSPGVRFNERESVLKFTPDPLPESPSSKSRSSSPSRPGSSQIAPVIHQVSPGAEHGSAALALVPGNGRNSSGRAAHFAPAFAEQPLSKTWKEPPKIQGLSKTDVYKKAAQLKCHMKAVLQKPRSQEDLSEKADLTTSNSQEDFRESTKRVSTMSEAVSMSPQFSSQIKDVRKRQDGLLDEVKQITAHPTRMKDGNGRSTGGMYALHEKLMNQASRAQSIFEKVVSSPVFDGCCAAVIIAYMALLGIETNASAHNGGEQYFHFFVASIGFNAWFTLELILRIAAEGKGFFYKSPDLPLNIMDVTLVLTSVVDLILGVVLGGGSAMDASIGVSRAMRVIRILRALRAVRLARIMQHVMQFRKMVYLIQGSLATLFWCLVILFLFIYVFAVIFTQGVTDHLGKDLEFETEMSLSQLELREHYGSIPRSINCLFKAMSSGVNWGVVFAPMLPMGPVYSALFVIFIAFSMFGVLNVLTSVFVESTVHVALTHRDLIQHEHEQNREIAIQHLREVFISIDIDNSGTLAKSEMTFFLQDPCVHSYLEALDINLHDSKTLFRLLDSDESGEIDIDEFCYGCLKLKGYAKSFDLHCLISEMSKFLNKFNAFADYSMGRFNSLEELLKAQDRSIQAWFDQQLPLVQVNDTPSSSRLRL